MSDLPNTLALTNIADGSQRIAAPVRNNFSDVATAVNALKDALASGTSKQVLLATDADTVAWGGGYTAYTPTLTAATVNPNLGATGSAVGRYVQIGKLVHAYGTITFGGAGAAAGTGLYTIALPVTAATGFSICGEVYTQHGAAMQTATARVRTTGVFDTVYPATWPAGAVGQFTDGAPWTWAAGDTISFSITYEAA